MGWDEEINLVGPTWRDAYHLTLIHVWLANVYPTTFVFFVINSYSLHKTRSRRYFVCLKKHETNFQDIVVSFLIILNFNFDLIKSFLRSYQNNVSRYCWPIMLAIIISLMLALNHYQSASFRSAVQVVTVTSFLSPLPPRTSRTVVSGSR